MGWLKITCKPKRHSTGSVKRWGVLLGGTLFMCDVKVPKEHDPDQPLPVPLPVEWTVEDFRLQLRDCQVRDPVKFNERKNSFVGGLAKEGIRMVVRNDHAGNGGLTGDEKHKQITIVSPRHRYTLEFETRMMRDGWMKDVSTGTTLPPTEYDGFNAELTGADFATKCRFCAMLGCQTYASSKDTICETGTRNGIVRSHDGRESWLRLKDQKAPEVWVVLFAGSMFSFPDPMLEAEPKEIGHFGYDEEHFALKEIFDNQGKLIGFKMVYTVTREDASVLERIEGYDKLIQEMSFFAKGEALNREWVNDIRANLTTPPCTLETMVNVKNEMKRNGDYGDHPLLSDGKSRAELGAQGWLGVLGHVNMHRKWFVLISGSLYYYNDPEMDKPPRLHLDVADCDFQVFPAEMRFTLIRGGNSKYEFIVDTHIEWNKWMQAIRRAITLKLPKVTKSVIEVCGGYASMSTKVIFSDVLFF